MKKIYYSISEVAKMLGVRASVLRFWEKEFKELHPKRGKGGRRFYKEEDIKLLEKIKYLLYDRKLTIKGAKSVLKEKKTSEPGENKELIKEIYKDLKALKKILGGD